MQLLLIHQNLPGRFRHLSTGLQRRGHRIMALAQDGAAQDLPGVLQLENSLALPIDPEDPRSQLRLPLEWRRQGAAGCAQLRGRGFQPDALLFHGAWGGLDRRNRAD